MITLEKARELLKAAVDTQGPDFVYSPGGRYGCYYEPVTVDECPDDPRKKTGCLVGVALNLAGETRHLKSTEYVSGIRAKYPDMMTEEAAEYLRTAQYVQDGGTPWGEALQAAEDSLQARVMANA